MKRLLCLFLLVTVPAIGLANTNINSTNAFSWGANIGFMNWKGDVTNGAVIGEYVLGGFVYGANVGWINVGELGVILQSDSIAPGIDTDGNGLPDGFEAAFFGHLGIDPNADPDGDGESNLSEYRSGTNPTDPSSVVHSA